jgi:hypothetical protein
VKGGRNASQLAPVKPAVKIYPSSLVIKGGYQSHPDIKDLFNPQ